MPPAVSARTVWLALVAVGLALAANHAIRPSTLPRPSTDERARATPSGLRAKPRERSATREPGDGEDLTLAAWLRRLDEPERAAKGDALVRLRTLGPRAASAVERVLLVFTLGDGGLDALAQSTLASLGPD